ncbi:class A beta-lactamase-related serine hydrolase [Microbacterium sp. ACRRU]|uniref:Serine hydrolase n=2 Tax=Microbacteriaceae TaxID=85023 RepID=A0ABW9GF66_9MICO|nr:serine hydrolase [Microbacterium sp. ACRRU]MCG7416825.1 class A beta-lactamase-related serine hydrolase [Microbacterium sp. ACRRU]
MGMPPVPEPAAPEPVGGPVESSRRDAPALRGSARKGPRRLPRRAAAGRRSFTTTLRALDELAASGAKVSVRIDDLDGGSAVLEGDDFITLPVAGLGVVPLLIEVAAAIEAGRVDALEIVDRATVHSASAGGVWQHLKAPALPLADAAVLAASAGDALAANALLQRVGLPAVRSRIEELGLRRTALLDRFRDDRGPDDAPHVALSTAREMAAVFAGLVNSTVVSAGVSAQVAEWLSLNHDLSLVASATGLDPFAHENDRHGLLFVNKTGRSEGVRAEAGVLGGPRAGVAYALIVNFDDLSIAHRLRAHDAFRVLGVELMEYVF